MAPWSHCTRAWCDQYEYIRSIWQPHHKTLCRDIGGILGWATRLLSHLKDKPYSDRYRHLRLPTLKCQLRRVISLILTNTSVVFSRTRTLSSQWQHTLGHGVTARRSSQLLPGWNWSTKLTLALAKYLVPFFLSFFFFHYSLLYCVTVCVPGNVIITVHIFAVMVNWNVHWSSH